MKDHKIYIFTSYNKEGEVTISQVYAISYYISFDLMVYLNPGFEEIEFVGMEETCMPQEWDYVTNKICLSN